MTRDEACIEIAKVEGVALPTPTVSDVIRDAVRDYGCQSDEEIINALAAELVRVGSQKMDLLAACQEAIDYIDGPDAPAVGMIAQDSLVNNAYVALTQVLESARQAIAHATEEPARVR